LVYAPWCGHCKKLDPVYEEFGKLASESKSASQALVVAKMDGTANKLPDEKYKVTGFPTVWFFKNGSDTPIKFMGERTIQGLASFVQQHGTWAVELAIA
ncbi:protein disulfide-isomerase, partial [Cyclospora cayetanensis]